MRALAALGCALFAACTGVDREPVRYYSRDAAVDAGTPKTDAGTPDAGTVTSTGAACPEPAALTPADVPTGYLAAETVGYRSTTDGDTMHFYFASGEQTVRLLYVNTEESHGSATTQFGLDTEDIVRGWMSSAREIVVVVREERRNPGQPDLDPYDRWLSLVFIDGVLLETRLIREGYSAYYTKFGCAPEPLHSAFVHAESEANENRRGIWQPGHPTDYRVVLDDWMGSSTCRPNPYEEPYCR